MFPEREHRAVMSASPTSVLLRLIDGSFQTVILFPCVSPSLSLGGQVINELSLAWYTHYGFNVAFSLSRLHVLLPRFSGHRFAVQE